MPLKTTKPTIFIFVFAYCLGVFSGLPADIDLIGYELTYVKEYNSWQNDCSFVKRSGILRSKTLRDTVVTDSWYSFAGKPLYFHELVFSYDHDSSMFDTSYLFLDVDTGGVRQYAGIDVSVRTSMMLLLKGRNGPEMWEFDPPYEIYVFPLTPDSSWITRPGIEWINEKKYLGKDTIATKWGDVICDKIHITLGKGYSGNDTSFYAKEWILNNVVVRKHIYRYTDSLMLFSDTGSVLLECEIKDTVRYELDSFGKNELSISRSGFSRRPYTGNANFPAGKVLLVSANGRLAASAVSGNFADGNMPGKLIGGGIYHVFDPNSSCGDRQGRVLSRFFHVK